MLTDEDRLILAHRGLVRKVVGRYAHDHRWVNYLDDLEAVGLVALWRALNMPKPDHISLSTHLVWRIRGALSQYARSVNRAPRSQPIAGEPGSRDDPDPHYHAACSQLLGLLDPHDAEILERRYLLGVPNAVMARERGLTWRQMEADVEGALARLRGRARQAKMENPLA